MKILFVTATEAEIESIRNISSDVHQLEFLVTGAGMVATTYELTRFLTSVKFDLAINCGIAGSFDKSISIGETVFVQDDFFSELGAEDDLQFLTIDSIGLEGITTIHNKSDEKFPVLNRFRKVKSITVNTVHGNEKSISSVMERLHPDIETMEGAAFYFVCEKEKIPCIQIRSISNYVEKRNRGTWNIPLALQSSFESVKQLLNEI